MGLLTGLLMLPAAPVRLTIALAEQIQRQAEREYYDPGSIRRELEKVEQMRVAGELSEAESEQMEEQLIERLIVGQQRTDLWED